MTSSEYHHVGGGGDGGGSGGGGASEKENLRSNENEAILLSSTREFFLVDPTIESKEESRSGETDRDELYELRRPNQMTTTSEDSKWMLLVSGSGSNGQKPRISASTVALKGSLTSPSRGILTENLNNEQNSSNLYPKKPYIPPNSYLNQSDMNFYMTRGGKQPALSHTDE